jgi:hypothetical protein
MGIEAMAMGAADGSVGRVDGDVVGDAATMEANAALRNIRHQDTDEGYRAMLNRLAEQSGIETPTQAPDPRPRPKPPATEDLIRLDSKPQGQEALQQKLGFQERPGRHDRQDG